MAQGLFCIEVRQVDKVTNVTALVQNLLLLRKYFTPTIPNIGGDLRSLVTELPCAHELREEEVYVCPTRLRATDHGWDSRSRASAGQWRQGLVGIRQCRGHQTCTGCPR